jgi:phage repressor protein C with HTH and peptisase S24 domain
MTLGARIEERLSELGLSQSELARRAELPQSTINSLIRKGRRSSPHLMRIARELLTTPEYLTGDSDDPGVRPVHAAPSLEASNDDDVEIDMIDLSYGMGQSFIDSDHVEIERVRFTRSWLRQFTNSEPHFLASTRGIGDSMMPTIHDRDVVIIDKSQTRLDGAMGDKIWAVIYGGAGMIKRLRPLPDGTVKLSSDNQYIRDELATDGELFIVGRVCAVVRSV